MKPESAGEKPVSVGVLNNIVRPDTGRPKIAGHALGPLIQVVLGIGPGNRFAGGSRRGMNPDDILHGDGAQAKGIVVAQVVFDGQGKFGDVFKGFDISRLDAQFIKFFLIKGDLFRIPRRRFPSIFPAEISACPPPACIQIHRSRASYSSFAIAKSGFDIIKGFQAQVID